MLGSLRVLRRSTRHAPQAVHTHTRCAAGFRGAGPRGDSAPAVLSGCDVSKFHPVDLPPQGARVRLDLGARGFVRSVQVLDEVADVSAGPRDHASVRLSVLTVAAIFAAGKAVAGVEVSSGDVLKIAEAWERWILAREEGQARGPAHPCAVPK